MVIRSDIIREKISGAALPLLALLAHPLVYGKLAMPHVPYWGEAELLGTGAIAMVCLGLVLARLPMGLDWKRLPPAARAWWAVLGVLLAAAVLRPVVSGSPLSSLPADLYHVAVPATGWMYAREIRKSFALSMTLLLGVLILFTIRSDCFQGLPGNWNWNLTMLAIAIPAPCVLGLPPRTRPRILVLSIGAAFVFLLVVSFARPDIAPKGTIFAVTAGLALAICAGRWRRGGIPAAAVVAAALLALPFALDRLVPQSSDIRIQFVRSARNLVAAHPFSGTGTGGYESEFQCHLTPEFHYCEYHTARNPHPHNEFWYLFGACGVAGAAFLIMSFLQAWGGAGRTGTSAYMLWCFLVLFLHGQADVLLAQPLPGTIFLLLCGAIPSRPRRGTPAPALFVAGAAVLLVAAVFAGRTFSSGLLYRRALLAKDAMERQRLAAASAEVMETERARYMNGVSLLETMRFQESASEFERLHNRLAPHGYVHSFAWEARAHASLGDFRKAVELLEKERRRYPHSVACQYFLWKAMGDSGADASAVDMERRRLDGLMKERRLGWERLREILLSTETDDEGTIFRF